MFIYTTPSIANTCFIFTFYTEWHELKPTEGSPVSSIQGKEDKGIFVHGERFKMFVDV